MVGTKAAVKAGLTVLTRAAPWVDLTVGMMAQQKADT